MSGIDSNTNAAADGSNAGSAGSTGGVKAKAADAYQAARERTSSAYGTVRGSASKARERTSSGIDSNPVAALAAGLALGAIAAAVLPRTRQEEKLLGGAGRKITETAKTAARSAIDEGKAKLDELGYNRENLQGKVQSLGSDAKEIAAAAASRAKETARS